MALIHYLLLSFFAASAYSAVSWYAGIARLYAYQHYVGNSYIQNIVDHCTVTEDTATLNYLQCGADAVTYLLGAAVAIGATGSRIGAAAEYIQNQGQTLWARDENNATATWNWTVIDSKPNAFYDILGTRLPGDIVLTGGNISSHGIPNSAAVMKHH